MASGVQISGKIKPFTTAAPKYPVFEDVDGQGSLQTVQAIADRDAILATFRKPGMMVYVRDNLCYYVLAEDLTTWDYLCTSTAVNRQTAWEIDDATGNDDNSGLPGHPLKTIEAFNDRVSPGFRKWVPLNGAIVTINAGSYGKPNFNLSIPASTYFANLVSFQCEESLGAPITLSAVTNTNGPTKTRGQLTTVGATNFTADTMYRSTSGAQTGALTYTLEQNASAKNFFVKGWFNYFSTGNVVVVANGTTCQAVTRLVSFIDVNITVDGPGYLEFLSANLTGEINTQVFANGGTMNFVGCSYTAQSGLNNYGEIYGSAVWWACEFKGPNPAVTSSVAMCQQFPIMEGCIIQRNCEITCYPGAILYLFNQNCFNGGNLAAIQASAGVFINDHVEFENGSTFGGSFGAVSVRSAGAITLLGGSLWTGTGGASPYPLGIYIDSLSRVSVSQIAQLAIQATQELNMTGHLLTFADGPRSYNRANCVLAISPDPTSTAQTT